MATTGVDPVIPLSIVTVIGLAFTYLGYDLFDLFLTWIGGLFGAGASAAVGWFILGSSASPELGGRVAIAAVLGLLGGLVGAGVVSVLARFAVVVGAFVASTLAGLLVFGADQLFRPGAIPENPENIDTGTISDVVLIDQIMAGEAQQALLLTLLVGFTGAALAYKFYSVVIAAATSVFGAVLLGAVLPLWQEGVLGGAELTFQLDAAFNGWTGLALITGFLFQSYRNSEEIEAFVDKAIGMVT